MDNRKIYVFTYRFNNDKREVVAYDFNGNRLGNAYLPDAKGAIAGQRFYYLSDNPEEECWELNRFPIKLNR